MVNTLAPNLAGPGRSGIDVHTSVDGSYCHVFLESWPEFSIPVDRYPLSPMENAAAPLRLALYASRLFTNDHLLVEGSYFAVVPPFVVLLSPPAIYPALLIAKAFAPVYPMVDVEGT